MRKIFGKYLYSKTMLEITPAIANVCGSFVFAVYLALHVYDVVAQ